MPWRPQNHTWGTKNPSNFAPNDALGTPKWHLGDVPERLGAPKVPFIMKYGKTSKTITTFPSLFEVQNGGKIMKNPWKNTKKLQTCFFINFTTFFYGFTPKNPWFSYPFLDGIRKRRFCKNSDFLMRKHYIFRFGGANKTLKFSVTNLAKIF